MSTHFKQIASLFLFLLGLSALGWYVFRCIHHIGADLFVSETETPVVPEVVVDEQPAETPAPSEETPTVVTPVSSSSDPVVSPTESVTKIAPPVVPSSDFFRQNGHFEEVGSMRESGMHSWWLNSGAYVDVSDGIARTVQGELEKNDKRRIYYKDYNASETDDGYHPQNIFRLVTKTKWKDFRQECYFKLNRYILSDDEHRSESNGFLLFNRYQDENNLYYTGVRVDGTVVVKKKIDGEYFTLGQKPVFPGTYHRKKSPNLLPIEKWIGVRSEVTTRADGAAVIRVSLDTEANGEWQQILAVTDTGKKYGGAVIKDDGYAGIRTDFMDAEFRDYQIEESPTDVKK